MKKSLVVVLAGVLLLGAGASVRAQQQYPPPYDAQAQQDQNAPPPDSQAPPPPQEQQAPPPPAQQSPAPQGPDTQMPPQPQGPPPGPQGQVNPSQEPGQVQPGVARLSFIHGDVSQQRGDNGEWVASTLNTPVEPGDRVTTGEGARAELQLDYADIMRMSNNVTANVVALTRNNIQLQVGQGLTTYSVLKGTEAQSEIDTPNAAVRPVGEGEYRILVNSNAETQVIVRNGSAEISTPQGTTRVDRGQMITIAGSDNPQYKIDPAPASDEWDSWNNDRDKRIDHAESWRHTDRYYTGSEDMDNHGTWSEIPDYGQVWTPSTDPGWAPYRDGRWVWEPYYGWTWVSYEPWGWAPYHYGRWFVYGGNWVWWPGPVAAYPGYYPLWAPAYVSFLGFGGGGWGLSLGFGFGGWGRIGWLPVGPGDWFHPWYGGWGGRYGAVGVGQFGGFHEGFSPLGRGGRFSNFDEALRNDRVRGGFTSMGGSEFGRGGVSMHQDGISEASFRQADVMTGRMPVNPSRESFSPSNRQVNPSTMRGGSFGSQHFFSSNRAGFAGSTGAGNRGESFGNSRGSFERPSSNGSSNRNFSNRASGGAPNGWHSFNSPQGGGANRSGEAFGNSRGSFSEPSRGQSQPESSMRNYGSQRQFDSTNAGSRGGYGGSSNSYNRPPLNMRQPIVTPRGGYNESGRSGSYNGGYNGGYNGSRGGGYGGSSAPRGNYSAPQGGGYRGSSGGGYQGGGSRGGGSGGSHGGNGRGSHGGNSHGGHSR